MSEMVETPEGRGRLRAVAELPGDRRVGVILEDGSPWTGSVKELVGDGDAERVERFKESLEQKGSVDE